MKPSRLYLFMLALILTAGCASTRSEGRSDARTLTQAEIEATGVSDLLAAVQQLRPRWLEVRAPRSINSPSGIVVFMGRTYIGGFESLRQFDAKNVVQLRYLDASQATATLSFPAGLAVEGAIVIELPAGVR